MTRTCLAVHHVAFETLGVFADPIRDAGFSVHMLDAPIADFDAIDPLEPDLMVLLGGPVGAYEADAYPFLINEIDWAKARLERQRPILGICLGAQVMTLALGAEVKPSIKEIGVAEIELTQLGHASVLRHLAACPVLHWHGDAMALPEGASHLARTGNTAVQAWSLERWALALQFHAEADPASIEHWLVGHASEIAASGIDPRAIRADVAQHGQRIAAAGQAMLAEWLAGLPP